MNTRPGYRAFSLVEVVISMLVVSVLLVAALQAVGASKTGQLTVADRTEAVLLAQDLLAEIVILPFEDPENASSIIGPETGEAAADDRIGLDDVDDYNGWNGDPPIERDGTPIDSASNLKRVVTVIWANPTTLAPAALVGTGVKRIDVVVLDGDRELARLFAFRSSSNRNAFELRRLSSLELVR